mmetsp:Transcript_17340/g.67425  ORF Transcript_17340/g.67425 Transcript_17340/m.67425 type:complete len:281 (-) Transcript_17340:141-983(-)
MSSDSPVPRLAALCTGLVGACDLVVCATAVWGIVRLLRGGGGERAAGGKLLFHATVALVMLARGVFLLLYPLLSSTALPVTWFDIWDHGTDLLFFVAFFLQLVFWADFVRLMERGERGELARRLRVPVCAFLLLLLALYLLYCTALLFWASDGDDLLLLDRVQAYLLSSLFFLVAAGYLWYGGRLCRALLHEDEWAKKKRRLAIRTGVLAAVITTCFVVRSVIGIFAAATEDADGAESLTFDIAWWFVIIFYGLCEALPTVALLAFHRPRKQSTSILVQQ